jgi:aminomethyltransferase
LERFVSWDQGEFIGLPALQESKSSGLSKTLAGFRLLERGVPRHGHTILSGQEPIGSVTSGTYSPTLDMGIGLGYVALEFSTPGTRIAIDIRGRRAEAEVATIPFYSRKR